MLFGGIVLRHGEEDCIANSDQNSGRILILLENTANQVGTMILGFQFFYQNNEIL